MCCRRQILTFCTSSLQGKPLWGRWPEFSYQAAFQCIASLICILPRKNSMAPLSRLPLQSNILGYELPHCIWVSWICVFWHAFHFVSWICVFSHAFHFVSSIFIDNTNHRSFKSACIDGTLVWLRRPPLRNFYPLSRRRLCSRRLCSRRLCSKSLWRRSGWTHGR